MVVIAALAAPAAAFAIDEDRDGRPPGVGAGTDCDDRDPSVYRGAADPSGDQFDQNCDDAVDADGDGYSLSTALNGPIGDCDDTDPAVNYGTGTCDSFARPDIDGDGYFRPFVVGDGVFDFDADCNDGRGDIHPGASEIVGNGVDEDCTGSDTPAPPPPPGGNLVANGDFESGVTGWRGSSASLSAIAGGVVGPGALRVARTGSASTYRAFASPRPVASTTAGTTYVLWAYVRSATPGKKVCVRAREYRPAGTVAKSVTTCAVATGSWVKLTPVAYTSVQSGNSVDIDVYQGSAVSGDSFDIDGVTLAGHG